MKAYPGRNRKGGSGILVFPKASGRNLASTENMACKSPSFSGREGNHPRGAAQLVISGRKYQSGERGNDAG